MKMRTMLAAALLALGAAAPALGQAVIAPGMSEDEVRARFGAPATTRTDGAWTYLFYHNGCPVRCGSDDVVFLRDGKVVAAVLRTAARRVQGPAADDALSGAGGREDNGRPTGADMRGETTAPVTRIRGDREDGPARVGGIRVDGERRDPVDEDEEEEEGDGSTTIIRRDDGPPPARAGALNAGARRDTSTVAPATPEEERQRAREGRVEPSTVRNQPREDSIQARRRARERAVTPRTVPPSQRP